MSSIDNKSNSSLLQPCHPSHPSYPQSAMQSHEGATSPDQPDQSKPLLFLFPKGIQIIIKEPCLKPYQIKPIHHIMLQATRLPACLCTKRIATLRLQLRKFKAADQSQIQPERSINSASRPRNVNTICTSPRPPSCEERMKKEGEKNQKDQLACMKTQTPR